jgi:hypothetical protein
LASTLKRRQVRHQQHPHALAAIANVPHNGISKICWKTVTLDHKNGAFVRAVPVQIPFEKNHQALETVRRPAVVKLQNLPPLLLLRHRTRHGFSA